MSYYGFVQFGLQHTVLTRFGGLPIYCLITATAPNILLTGAVKSRPVAAKMPIDLSLPAGYTQQHAHAHDRFYYEMMQIFQIRGTTDRDLNRDLLAYEAEDLEFSHGTGKKDMFERMFMHIVTLRTQILLETPHQEASAMTREQKIVWADKHLPLPFVHLLSEQTHGDDSLRILCFAAALPAAQTDTFHAFQRVVEMCVGEWADEGRAPALGESTMAEAVKAVGGRGGVTGVLGCGILEDGTVRRVAAVGGMWSLHDVRYMQST